MQFAHPDSQGSKPNIGTADILAVSQRLPATVQVFAQINRLLDSPQASLYEISRLIRLDPTLSFRVLQLSNGSFYGFRTPCSDLEEAVGRLGFKEINRLVGIIATQHLCAGFLPLYGISADIFWRDSLCAALASEWLAQRHAFGDSRTAYTAGLLRSVGKVVLDRLFHERPGLCLSYPESADKDPLLFWEEASFGCSNVQAAMVLMHGWRLPRILVNAVHLHCTPSGDEPLPHLLHLASATATAIHGPLPGEACYWQDSREVMELLEFDTELLDACRTEVIDQFDRIKHAFSD